MANNYEYQPPTGPLSGDSFENQTEDFFSRLRLDIDNNANAIDAVQRSQAQLESAVEDQISIFETELDGVADRIDGAISAASNALSVAQDAQATATRASQEVGTATIAAANAQATASAAQTSAGLATQAANAATSAAQAAQQAAANAVQTTGDQSITGVKTFVDSPIVPAPTTDTQAATKKYVDDAVAAGGKIYSGTAPIEVNNTTDTISVSAASTSAAGVVQLSNSTSSSSQYYAATSKAVYDALVAAKAYADTLTRTVTQTWHSGTEWYRVWSDGWIEQGGATLGSSDTVFNLYKAYSDTNYFCGVAISHPNGKPYTGYDWAMTNIAVWSKTTTSFIAVARAATSTSSTLWYACGY